MKRNQMMSKQGAAGQKPPKGKLASRLRPLVSVLLLIALAIAVYWFFTEIMYPSPHMGLADGEAAVHFIDVGQGDSVLIQTTRGCVLIDGGTPNMGERVVEYLSDTGISEIAFVVATHPHSDHIGGLIAVFEEFPVGAVITPNVAHDSRTFERFLEALEKYDIPVKEPIVGSTFSVGEAVFTIIAPNSESYQDLNDYSVSLRMALGSVAFVFTGDAERRSESEMTHHNFSADVLYVGHHGSRTSTTQVFLDAIDPSIAVISVGKDNSYGHPHDEVLERLHEAGVEVYRTDLHGNIVIVTDGAYITVRSQYDAIHN